MSNAIGVTNSVISGSTLTVTFGVTGASAIDGANFVVEFSPANVTGVSLLNPGFALYESNDVPLGRFAFAGLGSTLNPGATVFSLEITFSSPPTSLSIHVSGESSEGDLTALDVLLSNGTFNTLPMGSVLIGGTPLEGELLTASNSIVDEDGISGLTYHWQADNVDIGATGPTYTLTANEVGSVITVEARYTDGQGNNEVIESAATSAVVGLQAAPTGVPDVVAGTEDTQLQILASTLLGNDGDPNGDPLTISSVTSITGGTAVLNGGNVIFTPALNFNGAATFSYIASDGNGGFSGSTIVTVNLAPQNDPATGAVTISGTARAGQTLTASNSLADVDGLGAITYQWQADGIAIGGATGSTLAVGEDLIGKAITVVASFTDGGGTLETKTSAPTSEVLLLNLPPSGTVLIEGEFAIGETLQAVVDFTEPDGISSEFSYQWYRGGIQIPGATGATYDLTADDIDQYLRVGIGYTDGLGKSEVVFSQNTFIATDNHAPTGAPVILGEPVEGELLTADTSGIADADGLGAFAYQWLRGGAVINGATQPTYFLGSDDVGSVISLQVSYTDGGGANEQLLSGDTAEISGLATPNHIPTGLAAAFGNAEPGEILMVDAGSLDDEDGLGSFSYQWLVDGEPVAGATSDSFLLTESEVGKQVYASLQYTDGRGFEEQLETEVRLVADPLSDSFADLIRVYVIILGRAPAQSGLTFWGNQINGGKSFEEVANAMWNSAGAREVYPAGLTTEEQVTSFYENILNRSPAESGLAFWSDSWDTVGPVETMLRMIEVLSTSNSTDPQAVADKVLFQAKVDIGGYLARTLGSEDRELAADAYEFLEAGNSVAQTVAFINEQIAMNPNHAPTGVAAVFGIGEPGEMLMVDAGSVDDEDGLGSFSYQWFVNGEAVSGATSDAFLLAESEVGKQVYASLQYTDGRGFDEQLETEVRLVADPLSDSFADLIRVYVIILGRAPALGGLTFWNDQINGGQSFEEVAEAMWNSPGAREVYPEGLTTEEQVTSFYENILNRSPAESGLAFWSDSWDSVGPVETMLRMIEVLSSSNSSDPQAVSDKVLFQAKVDIGGYLAVTVGNDDIELAADAYEYLEAGNSVAETADFIDQAIAAIGAAPTEDPSIL